LPWAGVLAGFQPAGKSGAGLGRGPFLISHGSQFKSEEPLCISCEGRTGLPAVPLRNEGAEFLIAGGGKKPLHNGVETVVFAA
jgi:hypothetical protein